MRAARRPGSSGIAQQRLRRVVGALAGAAAIATASFPVGPIPAAAAPLAAASSAPASSATTTLVSVADSGGRSTSGSLGGAVSADGMVVAFTSYADDLVPGDRNGWRDVFVRDLRTGVTERVSVASDGAEGRGASGLASISADGRFVAFSSEAPNLVRGDTNRAEDVFVHDRRTGQTRRVSVSSKGVQGRGDSWQPGISADGRRIAFTSRAENLVAGDRNGKADVFVHDLATGATTRASVGPGGVEGDGFSFDAGISGDGRFVTFTSAATNLVPGDANDADDVFRHDLASARTELVSAGPDGLPAPGFSSGARPSGDGRLVVFASDAALVPGDGNGLPDVLVRDMATGTTRLVTRSPRGRAADGPSLMPGISADGRRVVFESEAANLVTRDANGVPDVFVHDLATGTTVLVSVRHDGRQATAGSFGGVLSGDGSVAVFTGGDPLLVDGYPDSRDPDEEPTIDVYRRGPIF
jgi:Tol biopolymer transport system component